MLFARPLAAAAALLLCGAPLGRAAEAESPSRQTAYAQAVEAYVTAAEQEIAAIRTEVQATEKAGKKVNLAPLKRSLDQCAELVKRLKSAPPSRFDFIKADYERTRASMVEKLAEAREG